MKSNLIQHIASSRFDAARSVKILPKGHKSRNLHGHSFWASILINSDKIATLNGLEHLNLKNYRYYSYAYLHVYNN